MMIPPPPPPPPSILPLNHGKKSSTETKKSDENDVLIDAIKRMVNLFKNNGDKSLSLLSLYNHCDSIIQSGPTCGLVALLMCLNLIKYPSINEIDLTIILKKCKSYGYTEFGEMFSVKNMIEFIRKEFRINAKHCYDLNKSMINVIEHLSTGQPILLPYDNDYNNEPTTSKKGYRAHWAMLCGYCLIIDENDNDELKSNSLINIDDDNVTIYRLNQQSDRLKLLNYIKQQQQQSSLIDKLFVYARHGKSKHLNLWNYHQLFQSNQNLQLISPKIMDDEILRQKMILPSSNGRLDESLSNQFIYIYNNKCD